MVLDSNSLAAAAEPHRDFLAGGNWRRWDFAFGLKIEDCNFGGAAGHYGPLWSYLFSVTFRHLVSINTFSSAARNPLAVKIGGETRMALLCLLEAA